MRIQKPEESASLETADHLFSMAMAGRRAGNRRLERLARERLQSLFGVRVVFPRESRSSAPQLRLHAEGGAQ